MLRLALARQIFFSALAGNLFAGYIWMGCQEFSFRYANHIYPSYTLVFDDKLYPQDLDVVNSFWVGENHNEYM